MTSLLSTRYVCSSCGHQHIRRHRPDDTLHRRWIIRCTGACKGKRRAHYPAYRPLSGRYA